MVRGANGQLVIAQTYWALKSEDFQKSALHTAIENQVFEEFQQEAFPNIVSLNELRPKKLDIPVSSVDWEKAKFRFQGGIIPDFNVVSRRAIETTAEFVDHNVLDDEVLKKTLEYNEARKKGITEAIPVKFLPSSPEAHSRESIPTKQEFDFLLVHLKLPFDKRDGAFFMRELKKASVRSVRLKDTLTDRERLLPFLQQVLDSDEIKNLSAKRIFPTRQELTIALGRALDEVLKKDYGTEHFRNLPKGAIEKGRFRRFDEGADMGSAESKRGLGACTRCHVGADALIEFPFDPSNSASFAEWLKKASSEQSQKWLTKIRARVMDGSMPPSDESEAQGFTPAQKEELIQFIERNLEKR